MGSARGWNQEKKKKFSSTVRFSGYGQDECQTNDVHVFDFGMYTWSKPVMKGTHPSPRDSHSSTAVGSKLYVFGGTNGISPLDDLFVLDNATNTSGKPDVFGDVPALREGHSASLISDNLFVFGGYTFVWKKISTAGVSPIPQDSHTCSSYKNCFVVMGDEDGGNPETMAWREVKTTGAELMPRAGHTKISHGKYLASTGVWATSNPSGSRPSPRFSLAGDSVDAERGILFVYEGCRLLLLMTLLPFLTIWLPFFCEEMLREKDPSEPKLSMQFQAHVQPLGKKMFEARESDVFNYGYRLEASISGKLFCGLLFSYKPGFAQAVQSYMASIFARRLVRRKQPESSCSWLRPSNRFTGMVHQDLKLDNILSKLNMRDKVVISTFRRYHHSVVHGS
ncbi:hypothetical protein SELMODRAFT_431513 [Selaginella moellendorffii]|uniref:Uncharacterized protein n=1 Tax=Selaginella moellendorffii TaxID=88036 RepID=D8TCX0_SELML|nr:hypothetical protein SELMODRAFT_431513 [Selaginella moellendorffii]